MRVNVTGVFLCCRAVVPAMREARWGRIITMSSGSVAGGASNYLHFPTSKAAVIGLTRALARELGGFNIADFGIVGGLTEILPLLTAEIRAARRALMRSETPHRKGTS